MTGFGRSESTWNDAPFTIELRSVNGRFLEASVKLPKSMAHMETVLRNALRQGISRGSVNCLVSLGTAEKSSIPLTYNEKLVTEYLRVAKEIQTHHQLSGDIRIEHVLALPDLFQFGEKEEDGRALEAHLLAQLQLAIDALKEMRRAEGLNLAKDMQQRVHRMDLLLQQVAEYDKGRPTQWKEKLVCRVQELMGDAQLDPVRVMQEVSLIADRLDITEEITRFHSHNQLFLKALEEDANQGKKLNFILQEMGREANTLGTKCQTAEIAELAIALKEEVEILREQVQNVE